jgi:hypothetical protein
VLGNVTASGPPTYAEALYIALDNGDGTVSIILDDAASRTKVMPTGMTNSVTDLNTAYQTWKAGLGPKPVPRRCGGALFLNTWYGEPVPAGKCDDGLTWAPGFCIKGANPWSAVSGTTAPMNGYMQLTQPGGAYQRALVSNNSCGTMRTVISETYVHMWEKNFDLPAGPCTAESNAGFCARMARNCGVVAGTDNCGTTRSVSSCGTCASPQTCGGGGTANVCGANNTTVYEAEALGNTFGGDASTSLCPEAYTKWGTESSAQATYSCSGGGKVRWLGGNSSDAVTINNITVPTAGTYTLTVQAASKDKRTFNITVNGGGGPSVSIDGPDWNNMSAATTTVTLKAGSNSLKFSNTSSAAPDLDKISISSTGASCSAESDAAFCSRLAKNCGSVTASDNCGKSRTVACGSCGSGKTCGGGGTANVCGSGGASSMACTAAYAKSTCVGYGLGKVVSMGGHNWTCSNGNCANCATFTTCEPGASGCPWGVVWTDSGACN